MPQRFAKYYAPGTARTVTPEFTNVPAAITAAAERFALSVALDFQGRTLTYRQLGQQIDIAAQGLLDRGIRKGDRVSLLLPMSLDAVIAFHAVLRIGAVVVQHSPHTPAAQLSRYFDDYEPVCAIVSEERLGVLTRIPSAALPLSVIAVPRPPSQLDVTKISLTGTISTLKRTAAVSTGKLARPFMKREKPAEKGGADGFYVGKWRSVLTSARIDADHPMPSGDDIALIMYGDEGGRHPLGSIITHGNLCAMAAQSLSWLADTQPGQEASLAMWPLHSVVGVADALTTSLFHGRRVILIPAFDRAAVAKAVKKHRPVVLAADTEVVDHLAALAHDGKLDIASIRVAFTPTSRITEETATSWLEATHQMPTIIGYGLEESCVVAAIPGISPHPEAIRALAAFSDSPGIVGIPFPATQMRVVDPSHRGRVLPTGDAGELMVKGPQVFHGYWGRPDKTSEVLTGDGWVLTGDMAVMDADGFVEILGRVSSGRKRDCPTGQ